MEILFSCIADLARGKPRGKIPDLKRAPHGKVTPHHQFLLERFGYLPKPSCRNTLLHPLMNSIQRPLVFPIRHAILAGADFPRNGSFEMRDRPSSLWADLPQRVREMHDRTIEGMANPQPHIEDRPNEIHWRFRSLAETLPAAAYFCDAAGLITYFNQHAVRVWGRQPALNDPVDRFCGSFKLFDPNGAPIPHEQCWMALALHNDREYIGEEIAIERPDGSRVTVLVLRYSLILGYTDVSFVRASSIFICQSTPRWVSLMSVAHAAVSSRSVSIFPIRRP